MNRAEPVYRRLPGRGLAFIGIGRLWLAPDHLLEVNSVLVAERYRRFFCKDIAAILIRRTQVRLAWNIVHGIFGFGGGAIAGGLYYAGRIAQLEEARIGLFILAGMAAPFALLFLALFSINALLGPSCRCHVLTTSAGWHALAAPTRLRSARRVVAELTPLIAASQSAPAAAAPFR